MFLTISGAYGRDYKSKAAILADWNAGKDFIIRNLEQAGRYINRQDAAGLCTLQVRFKQDRNVAVINQKGGAWK